MTTRMRALVVDDSAVFRKIISESLSEIPEVEVIGTAHNGLIALSRIESLHPDLVFLDIEMSEMNGFEVLQAIKSRGLDLGVIMVSAFTRRGSEMTIRALELGAFDFVTKATEGSIEENRRAMQSSLASVVKAYHRRFEIRSILKGGGPPPGQVRPPPTQAVSPTAARPAGTPDELVERMERLSRRSKANLVLIGISTGGPNALLQMMPRLPADLNVPIFIVQHMPPLFTQTLAESLSGRCAVRVKEAEDNEIAQPNTAYLAPGGKQMKIGADSSGKIVVRVNDDPPENNCKPSVDYLFRSAAHNFTGRACAVIMTGMGADGTLGLRLLKRGGCWVIAQDEASCVVFGMPKEAIEAGVVDVVLPLDSIADEIKRAVKGY